MLNVHQLAYATGYAGTGVQAEGFIAELLLSVDDRRSREGGSTARSGWERAEERGEEGPR